MADSDKDILITPSTGVATTHPKMTFTGKDNSPIDLKILDDNTLSFEGVQGQVFSISPILNSGDIFSVNDISGVQSMAINADGTISMFTNGNTRMTVGNNLTHINEANKNYDFRVDGEYADNLLLVDSSTGAVGINTVPDSDTSLHVFDYNNQATVVRIEGNDTDAGSSPILELRNSRAYASANYPTSVGLIKFSADTIDGIETVGSIALEQDSVSAPDSTSMQFKVKRSGLEVDNFRIRYSEVVVNEDSTDCNFRVEVDANTHGFHVDAELETVGINTIGLADSDLTIMPSIHRASARSTAVLQLRNANTSFPADGKFGTIEFYNADSSGAGISTSINALAAASGRGGYLEFKTGTTVGALSTKLTIKDDGKVGIGTTSPEDKLHISAGNLIFDTSGQQSSSDFAAHSKILFRDEADSTTRTMAGIGAERTAWSNSPHDLVFYTGNLSGSSSEDFDESTEKLRITDTGSIKTPLGNLNTCVVFGYNRTDMDSGAVSLKALVVESASTQNVWGYVMPKAGRVKMFALRTNNHEVTDTAEQIWKINRNNNNGGTAGVNHFQTSVQKGGTQVDTGVSGDAHMVIAASHSSTIYWGSVVVNLAFNAGEEIRIQRTTHGSVDMGDVSGQIFVEFD